MPTKPKPTTRHFKGALTSWKLKGKPMLDVVDDSHIAITFRMPVTKANTRNIPFLSAAKSQPVIELTIKSPQLELPVDAS